VLSVTALAARPEVTVSTVVCREHGRRFTDAEAPGEHRLVLVRSGRFRRASAHGTTDLDATLGYVSRPGVEERFAHPSGGDVCTAIAIAPARWAMLCPAGGREDFYVDARVDLAHRRLLGSEDDYALVEQLLALLSATVGLLPAGSAGDRALVAAAREAILADEPAAGGLFTLADHLGVSPYRLSRAFPREIGVSITRYRNRVRVGRALQRLEQGEPSLARLAADLGFADQAHLTRTVRVHTGHTPGALRQTVSAAARSGLR
jgi:AraC-like DNA-binding protein